MKEEGWGSSSSATETSSSVLSPRMSLWTMWTGLNSEYQGNFGHLKSSYLDVVVDSQFGFVQERGVAFAQRIGSEAEANGHFELFDHQFDSQIRSVSYLELSAYFNCYFSPEIEVEIQKTSVNLTLVDSEVLHRIKSTYMGIRSFSLSIILKNSKVTCSTISGFFLFKLVRI